MPWKNGGGTTAEIARSPAGAGLDDFDWRISAATVASDGPFSMFEGCDRTLVVLEGQGLTLRGDEFGSVALSRRSPPFAFAADRAVGSDLSDGPILDLNIMTRRGRFAHRVERREVHAPMVIAAATLTAIFCERGTIEFSDEDHVLGLRDTALITENTIISSKVPARIVLIHLDGVA